MTSAGGCKFHVHTSHHTVEDSTTWGMFWGLLFGALFFVPFLGVVMGAGLGALMGKITKSGIDREFQDQVRDLLKPGTSALFLMVEKVTPDKAVDALSQYGGTVLKSSLSKEGEKELQDALHGSGSLSGRACRATAGVTLANPAVPGPASGGHVRPSGAPASRKSGRGRRPPPRLERG